MSADANATVEIKLVCQLGLHFDSSQFPPAVTIEPEVTHANVKLSNFDVYRGSKVGGEISEQLGRSVRAVLERKLAENEERIVQKANNQIAQYQDKLRISVQEILQRRGGAEVGVRRPKKVFGFRDFVFPVLGCGGANACIALTEITTLHHPVDFGLRTSVFALPVPTTALKRSSGITIDVILNPNLSPTLTASPTAIR